jgi:hypothetical protein
VIRPAPRHFILRVGRKQEADFKPLPRPQSKHCSKLSLTPVIALKPESPKFVPKLSLAPVPELFPRVQNRRTGRWCLDLPLIEEDFNVRNIDGLEAFKDVVASIQSMWRGFSARATLDECQFAATVEEHAAVDDYEIEVEQHG